MGRPALDLKGKVFGRLTVIKKLEEKRNNYVMWLCKCSCQDNKYTEVRSTNLVKERGTRSCGCLIIENVTKHGACKSISKEGWTQLDYVIWNSMKTRCYNKKDPNYKRYGARGIKIYKVWKKDFVAFATYIRTLENCPNEEILTSRLKGKRLEVSLDRVDNSGNYGPGNIKWSTKKEQANNQRSNVMVTYEGKTMTLSQAVEEHSKVPYKIVLQRITRDKWTLQDALNTPSRRQRK